MPDRKDQYRIVDLFDAVKRDIAGFAPRDDQLPKAIAQWPPNEGMSNEQSDGFADQCEGFGRCVGV